MSYKMKLTFEHRMRIIQRRKINKYWNKLTKTQLLELTRHHGVRFSAKTTKKMLVQWLDYHIHERRCGC